MCFLKRAHDLPLADEVDFVKPIEAWFFEGPQKWGMWHAPFYPWLLMILTRLGGFEVGVERLLSCMTTLVSAALLYRTALLIRPGLSPSKRTLLIALTLLTPVSLGSALLLDYDNSLLMASTALFLYLLTFYRTPPRGQISGPALVLGAALGLCFMSKETTPLVYPIGILAAWWRPLGRLRAFGWSLAVLLLGCLVFLFVTKIWCDIYSIPLSGVFETDLLVLNLHAKIVPPVSWPHWLWIKAIPIFWLGWPLTLLFTARLRRISGDPTLRAIAAVVGTVLFSYTFAFNQRTFHFPKYMAPVLPWIAWLVILSEKNDIDDHKKGTPLTRKTLIWLVAVVAWFMILPDPMLVLYSRDTPGLLYNVGMTIAPLLVWQIFKLINTGRLLPWPAPPAISTFIFMMSFGLGAAYCREVLFGRSSVTYWYGEQTMAEARQEISNWKQRYPDGIIIAPMKDIQWNTRDLGSVFLSKDELIVQSTHYCQSTQPVLFVTRIREESSLLFAPEFEGYRKCLRTLKQGRDIALGSNQNL